tara:strand:- start:1478 stop:1822 length:345 start_codon:yes stop_codon:yes gene_type:complete
MTAHSIHTEGDEYACTCGLRWDTQEEDPHDELELRSFIAGFADLLEKHPNVTEATRQVYGNGPSIPGPEITGKDYFNYQYSIEGTVQVRCINSRVYARDYVNGKWNAWFSSDQR